MVSVTEIGKLPIKIQGQVQHGNPGHEYIGENAREKIESKVSALQKTLERNAQAA